MRSGDFRMSKFQCYLYMVIEQAQWLGWTVLVLSLALIVGGFMFSVWHGVASIAFAAFLSVMALGFVIIAYGFYSVTGANMTLHSLEIEDRSVSVVSDGEKILELPLSDIRPYRVYPGGAIVPVKGSRSGWLWVPASAFETAEDLSSFLKRLYHPAAEKTVTS